MIEGNGSKEDTKMIEEDVIESITVFMVVSGTSFPQKASTNPKD